jgi:hypothetical protein
MIGRNAIVAIFIALCPAFCFPQQIIENPERPLAKNAGRGLKLDEVWRIADDGGQFYFRHPYRLFLGPDGSLFLQDVDELLKFSAEGKFQKNLFKKGQGPGEIGGSFAFLLAGNELFVKDYGQRRFFRMDLDGGYLGPLDAAMRNNALLGVRPDGYLFIESVWPPASEQAGKLLPITDTVRLVSKDGKAVRNLYVFKTRWFMARGSAAQWDLNLEALGDDGKILFGSHSREYMIEAVDLDRDQSVVRFRRAYPRVKHVQEKWEDNFRKLGLPNIDYDSDVLELHVNRDRLWVKTSTVDAREGSLFDVFDFSGRFLDSFYLGPGRTLLMARGDEIYVTEKKPDESLVLVRYRIIEKER